MISALFALLLAAQAPADVNQKIISVTDPDGYRVDGQQIQSEVRNDPKVQGGRALRVHVPGKSANIWDVSVAIPINKPVKAGDKLVLALWGRLEAGENGATTATLPYNAVQLADAPYTAVFSGPVTVGKDWKLLDVQGVADHDYKAGQINAVIQLATARQVVDIGPVFVLDLGQ